MVMDSWDSLGQILLLLCAAVGAGVFLEWIGVNAIIGYLLAGMLVGPSVLDLVGGEGDAVAMIAELGVALLLFAVGLEITPGRLRSFGWRGAWLGVLQVSLTGITVFGVVVALQLEWRAALAIGAVVAMSSTAVVVRLLTDTSSLDAQHGRNALAALLSQDVIIVPLLILVSVLGNNSEATAIEGLERAAIGLLIIVGSLCLLGLVVLPRLMSTDMLRRNRDFAIVLAIATCLVSAWGSHALGLPPSLGSFLAGLLLARSSFARQIRADSSALRAVFLTLFFVSIGTLADLQWLLQPSNLFLVAIFLFGGLLIKGIATALAVRLCGANRRVAIETSLCLLQFGEFSFVLGSEALDGGLLGETLFQTLITASFLSLLATPFIVKNARPIAKWFDGMLVACRLCKPVAQPDTTVLQPQSGHIVIIGFGPAGKETAHSALLAGLHVQVVEMNAASVRQAILADIPALRGDATQIEFLEHANVANAAGIVVTLPDTEAAIAVVTNARALNPDAVIVVRARYERRVDDLRDAGADHVLAEETAVGTLLGATIVGRTTGIDAVLPEAEQLSS
jgi:CPA2 family monovalent cation:H+ antiporter-2